MVGDSCHHEQNAAKMNYLWYLMQCSCGQISKKLSSCCSLWGAESIDRCVLVVSRIARQAGMTEMEMAKIVKASTSRCQRPQTWMCTYS